MSRKRTINDTLMEGGRKEEKVLQENSF